MIRYSLFQVIHVPSISLFLFSFFKMSYLVFNYFWPHWVFIAMRAFSLVVAQGSNCPCFHESSIRDQTSVLCIGRQLLHQWTREALLFLFHSSFQIKVELEQGLLFLEVSVLTSHPKLPSSPFFLTMGLSFKASFSVVYNCSFFDGFLKDVKFLGHSYLK